MPPRVRRTRLSRSRSLSSRLGDLSRHRAGRRLTLVRDRGVKGCSYGDRRTGLDCQLVSGARVVGWAAINGNLRNRQASKVQIERGEVLCCVGFDLSPARNLVGVHVDVEGHRVAGNVISAVAQPGIERVVQPCRARTSGPNRRRRRFLRRGGCWLLSRSRYIPVVTCRNHGNGHQTRQSNPRGRLKGFEQSDSQAESESQLAALSWV